MADLASLRIHLQFCVLILFNNFDIIHMSYRNTLFEITIVQKPILID